ncbi:MAG: N-acetyltransferase [Synergistaceae bacterium]|nr:N-acetyltransferase [Synergistaceae bacterium]
MQIVFEEERNRSAAYDGDRQIGECEFSLSGGEWVITHTGVRPEYGGRGIARELVGKVIEEARARKMKVVPVCSYAKKMMEGREEYADVL